MNVASHYIQKYDEREKAAWFSATMYHDCMSIIDNITDGLKSFDALGTEPAVEDILVTPRNPRLQVQHKQIAEIVIDKFKKDKFVRYEDENAPTISFFPVIQSGGTYDLSIDSGSDESFFRDDVIILCFGIKYKNHCSNIMRTFVVTPKKNNKLKDNYTFLIEIQKKVVDTLRDGVELGEVYRETVHFVQTKRPDLLPNLVKRFGSIIGEEPKDERFNIRMYSEEIAKENMTFNINVGFRDIKDATLMNEPPNSYSLWIGDDVRVEKGKSATYLNPSETLKISDTSMEIAQEARVVKPVQS